MSDQDNDNPLAFGSAKPDPGAHDEPKIYSQKAVDPKPELVHPRPRKYAGRDGGRPGPFFVYGSPLYFILALPVVLLVYFFAAIFLIHRRRDLTRRQRSWRYIGVVALAALLVVPVFVFVAATASKPQPPRQLSKEEQFDKKDKQGFANYEKGNYDQAIADYSEALSIDPNNPRAADVTFNRGVSHHGKKDFDKAIADYTVAIRLNPKDASYFHNRAIAYHAKGDKEKAIEDYTQTIQLAPHRRWELELTIKKLKSPTGQIILPVPKIGKPDDKE